jgi:hypothetical protein
VPISELNYNLLQLLRDYKQTILYREAYRTLLFQYMPEPLQQTAIQTALGALQPRLDQKFLQAEQELQDGKDPRMVLGDFLHPKD